MAELSNPYLVIKAAFEQIELQKFREYLFEWLRAALSPTAIDEFMTAGEIISVYEYLKRMYSAAWLIHQRETEKTVLKEVIQEEGEFKKILI